MSDYNVRARLSAQDSGFTSTFNKALGTMKSLGAQVKSGFAFGVLQGVGQAAFHSITNGVRGLITEIDSSNASWKTFTKNMQMIGKSEDEIAKVKNELQDFAQKTIYSSSDMATTFAQLEAVGVKNTTNLVKGFGGLAAAAENPQQAMKTLSQQATQMAAKPTVAWQDFKLMLEQTPAGIAAVAKEMGMSTSELVTKVQAGEIATDKFFDAIAKVGTNDAFTELATEAKTVGQAMDGLKETVGNKLTPAFEVLNKKGISIIDKLGDKISGINAEGLATKVGNAVDKISKYFSAAREAFSGVGSEVWSAVKEIGAALFGMEGAFGSTESIEGFKSTMKSLADGIKTVAGFCKEHAGTIATFIKWLPALVLGFKGLQIAQVVAPGVMAFGKGITSLAGKGIGGIASKLFGISKAQKDVGDASVTSGTQMLTSAKSFALMGVAVLAIAIGFALLAQSAIALSNAGSGAIAIMAGLVVALVALGVGMAVLLKTLAPMGAQMMPVATAMLAMGAAVLLVCTGFALLAASSIALANAGGGAIAVMVGMVAAIALLAIGAAVLAPALTAGAVGLVAFGAAVLMVGAGLALCAVSALLSAVALKMIATVLPTLATSGLQGALAITALGGALVVFAVGAGVAGAAAVALGAGLLVAAAAVIVLAAGVLALAVGIAAVGVGIALVGAGLLVLGASTFMLSQYGISAAVALLVLNAALIVFSVGAVTAGVACLPLSVGLLSLGVSALAASIGVAAFGSAMLICAQAMLLCGVAAVLAATSLLIIGVALPMLIQYGLKGSLAIASLCAGLIVFGAGALVAGAACLVLGAGVLSVGVGLALVAAATLVAAAGVLLLASGALLVAASLAVVTVLLPIAAAGALLASASFTMLTATSIALAAGLLLASTQLLLVSGSAIVATAGIIAFGGGMTTGAVGVLAMLVALKGVGSQMKSIAKNAKTAQSSLKSMQASVKLVESGLNALGSKAKTALNKLKNAFDDTASQAESSGRKVGQGFTNGVQSGLMLAPAAAKMAVAIVVVTLKSGYSGAYSAGAYISKGFAMGMQSCLGVIQSAAAKMAAAADKAVRAKAKIHSPSKVADKLGGWWGEGYGNGLLDTAKYVWDAAEKLVTIPRVATPDLAMAYSGELSADYDYTRNAEYTIEVPLSIDGREVGKATARYTQEEIEKNETREARKHGRI